MATHVTRSHVCTAIDAQKEHKSSKTKSTKLQGTASITALSSARGTQTLQRIAGDPATTPTPCSLPHHRPFSLPQTSASSWPASSPAAWYRAARPCTPWLLAASTVWSMAVLNRVAPPQLPPLGPQMQFRRSSPLLHADDTASPLSILRRRHATPVANSTRTAPPHCWRLHCRATAVATPLSPPRRRPCHAAVAGAAAPAPTRSCSCYRAATAAAALLSLTRCRHRCGRAAIARECPARATTKYVHVTVAAPSGIQQAILTRLVSTVRPCGLYF